MKRESCMALLLVLMAAPGQAAGPVTDEGKPHPAREAWKNAVAGQNPLSADEAAATMAFMRICHEHGFIDAGGDALNVMALTDDIRAGGNDPNDFTEGGSKEPLFRRHLEGFREISEVYWAVACYINPYYAQ